MHEISSQPCASPVSSPIVRYLLPRLLVSTFIHGKDHNYVRKVRKACSGRRARPLLQLQLQVFTLHYTILHLHFEAKYRNRNSRIRGHSAGSSLPPHYGLCLVFLSREDFSLFFLRRLTPNCAYVPTLGTLSSLSFFILANNLKISPRRDSNSRNNTTNSSIRG